MTIPTDAELNELLGKHWPAFALQGAVPLTWLRSAMREAIAKWGQPLAVAGGEPVKRVFIVATGEEHEGEATYTRYDDTPPPLCDSECLYTAPPPQAVREPSQVERTCSAADMPFGRCCKAQPMPNLTQLTGRGAEAWAGVDAQALRGECTLQDFERSIAVRAEGREPFTPAQQERLYRNRPANVGKSASLAEWRRTVEFVEAAHGITKGGQHGDSSA